MGFRTAGICVLAAALVGCGPPLPKAALPEWKPEPAIDTEPQLIALLECAKRYAAQHIKTSATASELAEAAVSGCYNEKMAFQNAEYRAIVQEGGPQPRRMAEELARVAEEEARKHVLRFIVERRTQ